MLCAVLCVCGATRVRQSGIRFGLMDWDGARFWLIGLCVVLWNGILPGALRGLSQSTHATWIDNNTKHTQNHFNNARHTNALVARFRYAAWLFILVLVDVDRLCCLVNTNAHAPLRRRIATEKRCQSGIEMLAFDVQIKKICIRN